jgi:polysaccharide biosynthesis protein PelD
MRSIHRFMQGGAEETGTDRRAPPAWMTWAECLGISAALVVIGALIDRRDPFLLQRGFCWLTLAPLLAGLQYGPSRGLATAALQALALAAAWKSGLAQVPDTLAEIILGWLVTGLLAGEFRDAWRRRTGQLETFGEHARGRLESLGRAYLALKISHDRLRRASPPGSATLRDALCSFRSAVAEHPERASLECLGERILALFAEHAFVRAATIHPVDRKGRPGPAIAVLGPVAETQADPLVRRAARSGLTVSVRDGGEAGAVLVAVPLIDAACRAHAVVAVRDLPFPALHQETLELLAILGGRLGDSIAPPQGRPSRETAPAPAPALEAARALPVPARVEEAA